MQAIILLGGLGTRLKALYPDRPKALVPVLDRPFIAWQVAWLRQAGITDIHLAAGHQAEQIEAWANDQPDITVSREPYPLGTGGALKFIEPHIRTPSFVVLNGDTLLPQLNFQRLETDHQKASNAWTTLAVVHTEEASRFGTVTYDDDHTITAFREKSEQAAGYINGGVYMADHVLLNAIPAGPVFSLEHDLFPVWLEKRRIQAHPCEGPLLDMGTPEGLAEMEAYLRLHPLIA